jgi:hypothetical protein
MKFTAQVFALAISGYQLASAAVGEYNYDDQEAWKSIVYEAPTTNDCAKDANSPIDIPAAIASSCEENESRIQLSVSWRTAV